jgi:hypothetical protein
VSPRGGLDVVEKRKTLTPARIRTLAVQTFAIAIESVVK